MGASRPRKHIVDEEDNHAENALAINARLPWNTGKNRRDMPSQLRFRAVNPAARQTSTRLTLGTNTQSCLAYGYVSARNSATSIICWFVRSLATGIINAEFGPAASPER